MAQLIKNPPEMQETWVQYLDWEDPLEKGTATHSRILAWRMYSLDCTVHGFPKSQTHLSDFCIHIRGKAVGPWVIFTSKSHCVKKLMS